MNLHCTALLSLLLFSSVVAAQAEAGSSSATWSEFRGPNGDGTIHAKNLPVEFGETKNLRWVTDIHDKGWSSPVVFGNQVWLTTARADGRELFAVCVDLRTGKVVHDRKVFDVRQPQLENPKLNTHASPTPVVEAGRIYVHFGAYGTACLDTKTGETVWERRDLKCDHRVRAASSPILHGELLYLTFDGVDHRFVIALEKATGETRWRRDREGQTDPVEFFRKQGFKDPEASQMEKPNDNHKSYATPTVIAHAGRTQLISPAAEFTYAYDAATGEDLWRVRHVGGMGFNVASRPVYAGGLLYLTTGIAKRLLAVRPTGEGDVTRTHVAWTGRRAIPNYSSPLVVDGHVFHVNDQGGVASCLDAKTGATIWRKRLGDGGSHWASPVCADGKIYFCSDDGKVTVIRAGPKFEKLAENILDASFMASPAIAGDALILRSRDQLYCFAEGAKGGFGRSVTARKKARKPGKKAGTGELAALGARLKQAVKNGEMTEEEAIRKYRTAAAKAKAKKRRRK